MEIPYRIPSFISLGNSSIVIPKDENCQNYILHLPYYILIVSMNIPRICPIASRIALITVMALYKMKNLWKNFLFAIEPSSPSDTLLLSDLNSSWSVSNCFHCSSALLKIDRTWEIMKILSWSTNLYKTFNSNSHLIFYKRVLCISCSFSNHSYFKST